MVGRREEEGEVVEEIEKEEEEEEDEVVEPKRRTEGEAQESEQTGRVAAERGLKQATETAEWVETSTEGWMRVVEWRDEDEEDGEVMGEKDEEEEDEVVEPERRTEGEITERCKNRNRQGEWPLKGV